jgi:hypothetical protein
MCRPRAVAGPLSGTGPARRRCPQTCRGACATGPCSPCRGDRSWFGRVSVSRPIEGLDSPGAVRTLRSRWTRACTADALRPRVLASGRSECRGACCSAWRQHTCEAGTFARRAVVRSVRAAPRLSRPSMGRDTLIPSTKRAAAATGWTGVGRAGASTRLRAPATCWPGPGEWPAHGARSTHRKPARGRRPFRPASDARGAGATGPCSPCR